MCVADIGNGLNYTIKKWCIISLRGKNIADYTRELVEHLRVEQLGLVEYVLIEQQLNRNTQMKVLSHVIQTFFMCEARIPPSNIKFVSPKMRFTTSDPRYNTIVSECMQELAIAHKPNRREIKKLSIRMTEKILETRQEWLLYFNSHKKKDDLADSLVQLLAWCVERSVHNQHESLMEDL
jgi:hypothetical protein